MVVSQHSKFLDQFLLSHNEDGYSGGGGGTENIKLQIKETGFGLAIMRVTENNDGFQSRFSTQLVDQHLLNQHALAGV